MCRTGQAAKCFQRRRPIEECGESALPLAGKKDWEKFVFQTETFLVLIDPDYPDRMDAARRSTEPLDPEDMTDEARRMSIRLFGMHTSWAQESPAAARLARGVQHQNGFELWRLLLREFHPESHSKALSWRRTVPPPQISNPRVRLLLGFAGVGS